MVRTDRDTILKALWIMSIWLNTVAHIYISSWYYITVTLEQTKHLTLGLIVCKVKGRCSVMMRAWKEGDDVIKVEVIRVCKQVSKYI